jgi:hypothetical protein
MHPTGSSCHPTIDPLGCRGWPGAYPGATTDDALEAAGANIALAPTQIGCRSTLVRACSPSAA